MANHWLGMGGPVADPPFCDCRLGFRVGRVNSQDLPSLPGARGLIGGHYGYRITVTRDRLHRDL